VSDLFAKYGISPEKERELWREQNRKDLLYWADLPLTKKIELLEGMEEVARSIHGGKLPPSPDEHEERTSL
jgi:hypothetical protein